MKPLTAQAQEWLATRQLKGQKAIDATAGNGWDTLFLVKAVGPAGRVLSIDIQPEAIDATRVKLSQLDASGVKLMLGTHAELKQLVPPDWEQQVAVIMFNLGYLPSSDQQITTEADSTLSAIQQGLDLLKPGGRMTVLVYPGHTQGKREAEAVRQMMAELEQTSQYQIERRSNERDQERSPCLFLIQKCSAAIYSESSEPSGRP